MLGLVKKKKAEGTATTVTTRENAITEAFSKRFAMPLKFDFFLSILCILVN